MIAAEALLARLKGVEPAFQTKPAGPWMAFCPAHDDRHKRSLSIAAMPDKFLFRCFVGCTYDQIRAALHLEPRDVSSRNGPARPGARAPLTLEAFATAKNLPVSFLRACGLEEDARGLRITYRLADGTPAPRQRRRTALAAKDGSTWDGPTGTPPVAYGLWRLDEAVEKGELLLVEGESDALSAWYHNVPALGIPGADMVKVLTAEALRGIDRLDVVQEPDRGGAVFVTGVTRRLRELGWTGRAGAVALPVKDVNDLHREAGDRFADALARARAAATPLDSALIATPTAPTGRTHEPELTREGLDLALVWPDGVRVALTAIRDGREGVRGEVTITQAGERLSWTSLSLPSAQGREALRKKLEARAPDIPWSEYLEAAAWRFTEAVRQGEPLVTLTGTPTSPTRELMPRLLYEGEPTMLFGDGDTGKSLAGLAVAIAVHSGAALPLGLKAVRPVPVAYLDWETSRDTLETRLGLIAAGLGVDPPAIVYKRMTRPLVDEVAILAAEFARRGIGFVVIDSKMFAVAGGEGAAFHEPITGFYNALRLFAPAASLVLNHITGADARGSGPARPFGGAFAYNGPRLIWEVKRDRELAGTAVAFTNRKANNLSYIPEPFGLRFLPGPDRITIEPLDLTNAAPTVTAGASLAYRIRLALAQGIGTPETIAEHLQAKPDTIKRTLRRLRGAGTVHERADGVWEVVR